MSRDQTRELRAVLLFDDEARFRGLSIEVGTQEGEATVKWALRRVLKSGLMQVYCRGALPKGLTQKVFDAFGFRGI